MDPNQNDPNKVQNPYFVQTVSDTPATPQPTIPKEFGDTSEAYTDPLVDIRHWWEKLTKRQLIVIASVFSVALISGVTFVALATRKPPVTTGTTSGVTAKKVTKKDTPIVSALTGMTVKPEDRLRPVTAVMVENSMNARPQSGLMDAGIVYEAIAEAGITRFMALYQEAQPVNIGPIRSARLYYLQWAQGYDAAFAHVGGSPEALQYIRANPIKDMDQSYNSAYFQRITQRQAPHNVYTNMAKLNELEKAKEWFKEPNFTGFSRKAEAAAKTPTTNAIDIAISSPQYQVHYDYVKATNSYNRVMGGKPHTDNETGKQLSPKVVVTLVAPYSLQSDGYHSSYGVIGTGQAYVFQDGTVTEAVWTKASATDSLRLKNSAGKDLSLNPGQTWITAVGAIGSVTSRQ